MCVDEIKYGLIAAARGTFKLQADVRSRSRERIVNRYDTVCRRQCGPVVRVLPLRSGVPGFKTRSDHLLNLFLVVPGSISRLLL